jgi:hypothetical protein
MGRHVRANIVFCAAMDAHLAARTREFAMEQESDVLSCLPSPHSRQPSAAGTSAYSWNQPDIKIV